MGPGLLNARRQDTACLIRIIPQGDAARCSGHRETMRGKGGTDGAVRGGRPENMEGQRKLRDRLGFKFALTFLAFTAATVLAVSVFTYRMQDGAYRRQEEGVVRDTSESFARLLENDGEEFLWYSEYFMEHSGDMMVEYEGNYGHDVPDWHGRRERFDAAYAERYGTKVLGRDVAFSDMPPELQRLFAESQFCYWEKNMFDMTDAHGLTYIYVAVLTDPEKDIWAYSIDPLSEAKTVSGGMYRDLGFTFGGNSGAHARMRAVLDGEDVDGFESYDNEFGRTLACYSPVIIGGKTVGVVGAEAEADGVDRGAIASALSMAGLAAAAITAGMLAVLFLLNRSFVRRVVLLTGHVSEFSRTKDAGVSESISEISAEKDEIGTLGRAIAGMIQSICDYVDEIAEKDAKLESMKAYVEKLDAAAYRDALTGAGNKAAYDEVAKRLDWGILMHDTAFAIVMADLNYLKRINDSFGHARGDEYIKRMYAMLDKAFPDSAVFRIGGDEFAVVVQEDGVGMVSEMVAGLKNEMYKLMSDESLEPWEQVSIALGWSVFKKDRDGSVDMVLKRADDAMYADKEAMHAGRE